MSYLQEILKDLGATQSQLQSSTVKLVEKAMLIDSDFCKKVAADALERMAVRFETVDEELVKIQEISDTALSKVKENAASLQEALNKNMKDWMTARERNEGEIRAYQLSEAVKTYRDILKTTLDIFGKDPLIAEKSIEAADHVILKWITEQGKKE